MRNYCMLKEIIKAKIMSDQIFGNMFKLLNKNGFFSVSLIRYF